jgi:CheY-like chemotaxis protein
MMRSVDPSPSAVATSPSARDGSTRLQILLAEDDDDDRRLTRDALRASGIPHEMTCVVDGQELLDYLRQRGRWTTTATQPPPAIILLDLNLPKKDGCEALAEIKADRALRRIPVVVLAGSADEADVDRTYELGGSGFIVKRHTFGGLTEAMRIWARYWLQTVALPIGSSNDYGTP